MGLPVSTGTGGRARVAVVPALLMAALAWVLVWAAPGAGQARGIGREAPATPFALQVAHNSPELVAEPADPRFVVMASRRDAPDFGCSLHVSGDGGRSWVPADPVPELPAGAEKCYAPQVAFGPEGTLYYLFVGLHGPGNRPMGTFLTTSDDRGRTFSRPWKVLGPRRFQVALALDRARGEAGRLHLTWLSPSADPPTGGMPPPPNPIMAAHSDDGGRTWSQPVQVSDPGRDRVVAPALAVGADGAVHVAYYDLEGDARDYRGLEGPVWEGTWSVVATTSRDGGRHFAPEVVVENGVVPAERVMLIFTMPPPALAADSTGRLVIAWQDARRGDADIVTARSTDGGASWRGPVRVNDDPVGNGATQSLPQVAFSPGGRLDSIFYDRRQDPDNRYADVFHAFSADGGATFSPNVRVTSEPTDSDNGQIYPIPSAEGQAEFGSRLGLLARDGGAVAAWADTRNALVTPQQALFTAPIDFPSDAGNTPVAGLAAGLVVASLAAHLLAARQADTRREWRRAGDVGRRWLGAGFESTPPGLAWTALGALVVAAVVAGAGGRPLPVGPAEVELTITEHAFQPAQADIPAGRVVLRVHNAGSQPHELVVVPLPEDLPGGLGEALNSPTGRAMTVLAQLEPRRPGQTMIVALDLPPGRYGLACLRGGEEGTSHAQRGETAELRVRP